METFERHILNILNKLAGDKGIYGEFYFLKSHKEGRPPIMKTFLVRLYFKTPGSNTEVWTFQKTCTVKTEHIYSEYEQILEVLLYKLISDKKLLDSLWSSISTKPQ